MDNKKKAFVTSIDGLPLMAFSSKLRAQQYVESRCKSYLKESFTPSNGFWEDDLNYIYKRDGNRDMHYEIDAVDIDDSIELPFLPTIEEENLALKEENNDLRRQLAHAKELNAAALCHLVMWDGGWKYAKEHVLENMHEARSILEDTDAGNAAVEAMFERWLQSRCSSCNKKK